MYRRGMESTSLPDRNWEFLVKLLPSKWEELARTSGAVTRMRGFESVESLLRTLLLHVGLGCSLRETSTMAKAAGWVEMSDVALLKKLRKSEGWLRALCVELLSEGAMSVPKQGQLRMRLVDGTVISEPGKTGSVWRIHYSLNVPQWTCDDFTLTPTEGVGTGESLRQFEVREGECLIGDRGYAHIAGLEHVHQSGGHAIIRHNPSALPLYDEAGARFETTRRLRALKNSGQVGSWPAFIALGEDQRLPVRVCAVRKSPEAILQSQRALRRRAQRKGNQLRSETIELAKWVIVVTTVPEAVLTDVLVLEWYRVRWQIELAFKRLKSLAGFGHLPKHDPQSSKAWLYGKLLVALLTEKMQRYSNAFSPWGCEWCEQESTAQSLA